MYTLVAFIVGFQSIICCKTYKNYSFHGDFTIDKF